jgi:hypothetical protein
MVSLWAMSCATCKRSPSTCSDLLLPLFQLKAVRPCRSLQSTASRPWPTPSNASRLVFHAYFKFKMSLYLRCCCSFSAQAHVAFSLPCALLVVAAWAARSGDVALIYRDGSTTFTPSTLVQRKRLRKAHVLGLESAALARHGKNLFDYLVAIGGGGGNRGCSQHSGGGGGSGGGEGSGGGGDRQQAATRSQAASFICSSGSSRSSSHQGGLVDPDGSGGVADDGEVEKQGGEDPSDVFRRLMTDAGLAYSDKEQLEDSIATMTHKDAVAVVFAFSSPRGGSSGGDGGERGESAGSRSSRSSSNNGADDDGPAAAAAAAAGASSPPGECFFFLPLVPALAAVASLRQQQHPPPIGGLGGPNAVAAAARLVRAVRDAVFERLLYNPLVVRFACGSTSHRVQHIAFSTCVRAHASTLVDGSDDR